MCAAVLFPLSPAHSKPAQQATNINQAVLVVSQIRLTILIQLLLLALRKSV